MNYKKRLVIFTLKKILDRMVSTKSFLKSLVVRFVSHIIDAEHVENATRT